MSRKIVVIGGVAGGASAAARLRRLDERAEIIIIERSGYVSYANCGLPYYVGGIIEDREDLTLQTPESFRARFNIDVRVNNEVLAIDRENKLLRVRRLADGSEYEESYDKLILSPGAKALVPDLPGVDLPQVRTLRTVEDALGLRELALNCSPRRAVVIGGGFIGLEAAECLVSAGLSVTLLQRSSQLLPPLDADMAALLHTHVREKGVDLRFKQSVTGFEPDGEGLRVTLRDSEPVSCGLALVAAGVVPETELAASAGLELGVKGSIIVNTHMQTSDPDIYAVGDAVCVRQLVSGAEAVIPLAGPANRQGRIAADNLCGIASEYKGSQGSTIVRVFDLCCAVTGLSEKTASAAGIEYDKVLNYSASHAVYYPGGENMTIKTLFEPKTGRILGAQLIGADGVDKRADVLATAIRSGLTAGDLAELELCYAPPYSSAKDPVNMAGFTIENVRGGIVKQYHWHDVAALPRDGSVTLLDVRSASEFAGGHIEGAVNIPLPELRARLGELDASKTLYVNCYSGMRSYIACRILTGHGFTCQNLSGGWRFYSAVTTENPDTPHYPCGERK